MQDFLRHKDTMLIKPYSAFLYVSPNLDATASHLSNEHQFLAKMDQLASPIPIHYLGSLPTVETILSYVPPDGGRICLFLDDFQVNVPQFLCIILSTLDFFQDELFSSRHVADVFTRLSSHFDCDIVATSHSGFANSKYFGTIWKNLTMIVIFPCISDKTLLTYLGRKITPGQPGYLQAAQNHAYAKLGPYYSYIVIEAVLDKQLCMKFPIKSNIWPHKNAQGEMVVQPYYYGYKEEKKCQTI